MGRLLTFALLCAALTLASCSGGAIVREVAKADKPVKVDTRCDADEAGVPCVMRFFVADHEMASAEWEIHGKKYTSTKPNGEIYVEFDKPGGVDAHFKGVDTAGRDCHEDHGGVKFHARQRANAAPIVADFGGPIFNGTFLPFGGGSFHEWRWRDAKFYDPEGDAFTVDWYVVSGDDVDGDGLPDTVLSAMLADGNWANYDPFQVMITFTDKDGPVVGPNNLALWVWQLPTVDRDARIVVKLTDAQGNSRKWGDGHVTLMK